MTLEYVNKILEFSSMMPPGDESDAEILCDEIEKLPEKDRTQAYILCICFRCAERAKPLLKTMLRRNLIPNIQEEMPEGKYFDKLPGWAKNIMTGTYNYPDDCGCGPPRTLTIIHL